MIYAPANIHTLTRTSYSIAAGDYDGLGSWLSKQIHSVQRIVQQALPAPLRKIVTSVDNAVNKSTSKASTWATNHKKALLTVAAIATAAWGGYALYSAYGVEAAAGAAGAAGAGEGVTATTYLAAETMSPLVTGAGAAAEGLTVGTTAAGAAAAGTSTGGLFASILGGVKTTAELATLGMGIATAKARMGTAEDQQKMAEAQYQSFTQPPQGINTAPMFAGSGGGGGGGDFTPTGATQESPATQQPSVLPYLLAAAVALALFD
jgi:hypothetical protein